MGQPKKRARPSATKSKKTSKVKFQEVVLIHPPTGFYKQSAYGQLVRKNIARKYFKRNINKKKFTKEQKALLTHIKKYKSAVAKKYNKELVAGMKDKGYFPFQIKHAKEYSYVGKKVRIEVDKIRLLTYNRTGTKGLVNGKWKTKKQIDAMVKRKVKQARIKSYKEILGINDKKAKQILKLIDKKSPAALAYLALIY